MKGKMFFPTSLSFLLLMALGACSKSKDTNTMMPIVEGNWTITYYWDRDHEETSLFAGYTFDFQANDIVEVLVSGVPSTGIWLQGTDESTPKLIVTFTNSPLSDLNEDWHVIEQSNSRIRLQHVSGGDGHIDYLTFERQ